MIELDGFFSNVSIYELFSGAKLLGSNLKHFDGRELSGSKFPYESIFVQIGSKGAEKQLEAEF